MFTCEMKILTLATPKAKPGKAKSACKGQEAQKQNSSGSGNNSVQKSQIKSGQKVNKAINKKCQQQPSKSTNNNNNLVKNQNILDEIMQLTPLKNPSAPILNKTLNTPQTLYTPKSHHTIHDTVITHNNKDTSAATPNTPLSSCKADNNDLSQSLLSRNQRNNPHRQECEPLSSAGNSAAGGAAQSDVNVFTGTITTSESQTTGNENKNITGSDTNYWGSNAKVEEPSTSNNTKPNNGAAGTNDGQDIAGQGRNYKRNRNWKNNRHYSSTDDRKNYDRHYERNDAPKTNYAQSRQNSTNYEALKQNPLNYDATKQASGASAKQAKPNNSVPNNTSSKQLESQIPKQNAFATSSKPTNFNESTRPNAFGVSSQPNPSPNFETTASKLGTANGISSKPPGSPNFDSVSRQSNMRYDQPSKPHFDTASTRTNNARFDNQKRSGGNYEMTKQGPSNYETNRQNNNRFEYSRQNSNNHDNSRRSSVSYDSGKPSSASYDSSSKQDMSSRPSNSRQDSISSSTFDSNSRVSGPNNGPTNRVPFKQTEYRCGSAECLKNNLLCPHRCDVHEEPPTNQHPNNRSNRRSQFYRNNTHYNYITQMRRDRQNSYEYQQESKNNMAHGGSNNQGRYQNSFRNNNKFANCGSEYQRRNNQFNRFEQGVNRKQAEAPSKPETKHVGQANPNINAFTGKPITSSLSSDVNQKEIVTTISADAVKPTRAEKSETLPQPTEMVTARPENPFLQSICSAQRVEMESKAALPPQQALASEVDFFFTPKAAPVNPQPQPSLPAIIQPAQIMQAAQMIESAQVSKSAQTSHSVQALEAAQTVQPAKTVQPAQTLQAPHTVPTTSEPTTQAAQIPRSVPTSTADPVTPSAPAQTRKQLPGPLGRATSVSSLKPHPRPPRSIPLIQKSEYSLDFLHRLGATLACENGLAAPFPFQDSEITLSSPVRNIYHSDFVVPFFPCYAQEQQQAGMNFNDTMNSNANSNGGRQYPNHQQYQGNNRMPNYYPQHSYPMQNNGNYNGASFTQGFSENLRILPNGIPNQVLTASGPRSPSYTYYNAPSVAGSVGGGNKCQGFSGGYGNQKYAPANNPHANYGNGKKQPQHNQISSSASERSCSPTASISPGYRQSISKTRSNQSLAIDSASKYSNRSAHRMNYNQQHQNAQTHYNGGHSGHYQTNISYQTYHPRPAPSTPVPVDSQNFPHVSYVNAMISESMPRSNSPSTVSLTQSIVSTVSSSGTAYIQNQNQFNQCYRPDQYGNNRKRYPKPVSNARSSQVSAFSMGNQLGTGFRVDKSTTATVADFVESSSSFSSIFIAGNDMDSDCSSTRSFNHRKSDATQSQSPVSRSSTASSSSSTSLQPSQKTDTNSEVIAKPLPKLSDVVDFKSYSIFILCHSQELAKHLIITTRPHPSAQQQATQQYVSYERGQSPPTEKNPDRLLELWGAASSCNYYSEIYPLTTGSTPSDGRSPSLSPRHNNQQGDSAEVCHSCVSQATNIPLHVTTFIGTTADPHLMQMGHLSESVLPNPCWLYLPYNQEKAKLPPTAPQGDSVTSHVFASMSLKNNLITPHQLETLNMPCKVANISKFDQLSQGIWAKFVEAQQTEKTFMQKLHLWRFLNATIKNIYPRYGLYIVGSTITGFGADSSDADMCLISRINPHCDARLEAISNLVHLRETLRKTKQFEEFNLIEARVPILRFRDRVHGQEVDLNYNNAVGIRNTHLLYLYSQLDWRLRPLVLLTKQWAQFHDINNAKNMTISSYSLVLMMIHYLQCGAKPHVLPCLHAMYPDKFPLLRSNNDFGFVDMTEVAGVFTSSNRQTLGELFMGFLEYYSLFRYHEFAISVRKGGVIPIVNCRQAKGQRNDMHQWKELCIEEPFDLTNTARSVYDYETFERVKWVFVSSWRMLSETLTLDALFTPVAVIPLITNQYPLQYATENITGLEETATDTESLTSAYSSVHNEENVSSNTQGSEDEVQEVNTHPEDVNTQIDNAPGNSSHRSTASVASVATIEAITSDTTAMLSPTPAQLTKSATVTTKDAAVEVTVKTSPQGDYRKQQTAGKTANTAVAAL